MTAAPSPGDRATAISVLGKRLTEGGMTAKAARRLATALVDKAIRERAAGDDSADGPEDGTAPAP
jgi:hypothetical protein